jgi:hypothetical protein
VILAVDDPTVSGAVRPEEMREQYPTFGEYLLTTPDGGWRCASCYRTRFKTMCFGLNEAGGNYCIHCGKSALEAGFTLWFWYADLPESMQAFVNRHYGHKLTALIRTLFPDASLTYEDDNNIPSI